MKKLLLSVLFAVSATAFAQEMKPKALVLVNGMIASQQLVDSDQSNVVSMNVYKNTNNIPADLKVFEQFAQNGFSNVKVKENYYDRLELSLLNKQYELPENTPVYVDGNLITQSDIKILGNVLENVQKKEINGQQMLVIKTSPM